MCIRDRAAGVTACLIANQVFADVDLQGIVDLKHAHAGLRVLFLVDSVTQLALIEGWHQRQAVPLAFEVLLEVGVSGGRTGCRTLAQALRLAEHLHHSAAVQLAGVECYEGLGATGQTVQDVAYAQPLMDLVQAVATACDAQNWFDVDEIILLSLIHI